MKIVLGADHGGADLKDLLVEHLQEKGFEVLDLGTHGKESVDYPEYGRNTAQAVVDGKGDFGIVCCGSGIGISIAANKVPGARCALVHEPYGAEMARKHNNANLIALGGRMIGPDMGKKIVDVFLSTEFEGGRHLRRINALEE